MQVEHVAVSRTEARKLYRAYQAHVAYSKPIDLEIQRAYAHLAKGRTIIRALESIKRAGLNRDFLPRLALAPAMASHCHILRRNDGSLTMSTDERWFRHSNKKHYFAESTFVFPRESFPLDWSGKSRNTTSQHRAQVPLIPVHLRPKRGLANYHILWEAEWERIPPRDPYLLRRIGKSDLWLVVAHWDLTDIERAVLATRV